MRLRDGMAACAVSLLATVFSVQQGEHGPLVVYKLQVPTTPSAPVPAAVLPSAPAQSFPTQANPGLPEAPRLRSTITKVPQQPATRSRDTLVLPASALPPPRTVPVPLAVPGAVYGARQLPLAAAPSPPPAELTPAAPHPIAQAPLQPRVLGTVRLSDIEALADIEPLPLLPEQGDVFRIVEESDFGTAMINEDTGDSLTLKDVNDAALWRRDTAERLRQIPIAPRF